MKICPFCASDNIYFSKKRSIYICEDCDKSFASPAEESGFRVFISYGHDRNSEVVKKIKAFLAAHGYDVWIDTSEITPGKDWRERITSGLLGSNGVISFLSKHSVRNPGVCLDELKIAFRIKRAYLKSVLLEDSAELSPPSIVSNIQWIDMSRWQTIPEADWDEYFAEKMSELLAALRSEEATEYSRELDLISEKLGIVTNHAKEQFLLRQSFVGREWLTERVYNWMNCSKQPRFMIYGVPGAGKSAFAVNLIQYDPNVVGNIIFEWDHSGLRDTDGVVRRLAFELASNLHDYRKMLLNLLGNKSAEESIKQLHGAMLFDQLILNPIQCCIDGERGRVLVVFDGLDETSTEVAELLLRKTDKFPEWIKFLFTSRYDEAYDSYFDDSCEISLSGTYEENIRDIREYLAYRLNLGIDEDITRRLAEKTEGSFMYAAAFCDAVESGNMSPGDEGVIPKGIDNFYRIFFRRMFPAKESFFEVKPLLELLATDDDIPELLARDALELTKHELWELRYSVKSLIVNTELEIHRHKLKGLRLVHKSIMDWLTDEQSAKEFYIDQKNGYKLLVRYTEEISSAYEKLDKPYYELLKSADNPETVDKAYRNLLRSYAGSNYVKWLIRSGDCDKAKRYLLDSFSEDNARRDFGNYQEYYRYHADWQWADEFPSDYPIDELVEKLEQLALYPHRHMVSSYAHRSFQITGFIFRGLMDSGRYATAFYAFMRKIKYHGYFASGASDESETRDGWDKYFMTRDCAVCIKKLQKLGVDIPEDVFEACERMKLTYNHYYGKPNAGMFNGNNIIQREPEMFKDICRISECSTAVIYYNTNSLRYYLAASDEEDLEFIAYCIAYHADLAQACEMAREDIEKQRWKYYETLKKREQRLEFIAAVEKMDFKA